MTVWIKLFFPFFIFVVIQLCLAHAVYFVHNNFFQNNEFGRLFLDDQFDNSYHKELQILAKLAYSYIVVNVMFVIWYFSIYYDHLKLADTRSKEHRDSIRMYKMTTETLHREIDILKRERDILRQQKDVSSGECVICQDDTVTHMAFPCGHYCVCQGCSEQESVVGMCPICRDVVGTWTRVYSVK